MLRKRAAGLAVATVGLVLLPLAMRLSSSPAAPSTLVAPPVTAAPASSAEPVAATPTTEPAPVETTTTEATTPPAPPTTRAPAPAPVPTTAAPKRTTTSAPATTKKPASPAAAAANPSSFAFSGSDSRGRHARWDPCTPIRWAFNPDQAPAGALVLVTTAITKLSVATGLGFVYVGPTTFKPLSVPERTYPVGIDAVIAFASGAEYSDLAGSTFGLGGFVSTPTADGPRIIHGGVVLNGSLVSTVPDGFGPGRRRGGAVLHELGHMVGLAHVDDPSQLMHDAITTVSPADYAAGDLNGLAQLGSRASCFPAR
jgi:hypothetical protein